jgi:multicomponent Na+:H+ antiporter subunit E
MPARGLRRKPGPGPHGHRWEVVFTCPACGLLTTFDLERASPRLLRSIPGTLWTARLRQYRAMAPAEEAPHERQATRYHFLSTFVIAFITWIVLTGSLLPIDLIWGAVACAIVARFTYRLVAFELPRWVTSPRRWVAFFALLLELAVQLVRQNISLSIRVLRPSLPIRPGIVAVPTRLHDDVTLTILGSLITLTPDTVALDIDERRGLIYVHWIDVRAAAPEEVRRLVSASFEDKVIRWLM